MEESGSKTILGILGGMGPLASAEFVRTIYDNCLGEHEQHSPAVIMYSDPSLPDRTETLLGQDTDRLLEGLIKGLTFLCESNATRIVICCVTAHYLLQKLPLQFKERIISLLDVISASVSQRKERQLLICTRGTRLAGLFQNHPRWEHIREFIVWPDEPDQIKVHDDLLYQIKKRTPVAELAPLVESLLNKYDVSSFIAGCTEMHLLSKHFDSNGDSGKGYRCVDPLTIIARNIALGSGQNVGLKGGQTQSAYVPDLY
jgi:aspartate racemase